MEDQHELESYTLIDDKNVPAPTLAKRRLKLMSDGKKLKKLGRAVFFLGDLVKIAKANMWFIDSMGSVFRYSKSQRAQLIFRKIKSLHIIPTGGAIVEVEGIPSRFKCLFAPSLGETHAGVLKLGMQYILYGLYDTLHKDTWRKV